jgi:2,4-diketo-3-deoxy-L-fuconate hydrolase
MDSIFFNNYVTLHSRTEFEDHEEIERRRHLLRLWLDVDGHRYQNGTTATMEFRVPHLIIYLSRFMSLQPGDVISTGTPPGVGLGQKPPVYLRAGQVITLGIDGLGEQRQRTVQA